MIQFSKVQKCYGDRVLFDEASFVLGKGERCGVVGRNGSGKSTLFQLILGNECLDDGTITIPKHYRLGSLEQHIRFIKTTVIKEAMSRLPEEQQGEEYRAEIILTGLGFSLQDMDRDPKQLSGGFQLRLQLAKVLLEEPDCLLLDEPTNYLDIVAIRWLEKFLRQWRGELMVISHDKTFLDRVVTHVLGIYRNKIHKLKGDTEKFYDQMLLQDEIHEQTAKRNEKKRAHMQSFVDRFGAKATKASQAKSRLKSIERLPVMEQLAALENLHFEFKYADFHAKRMLELSKVHFSYDQPSVGSLEPFSIRNLDIEIEKGDRIAIIGKNGRGKSTILSLIAGILKPSGGDWWISENLQIGHFGQTNIDRLHLTNTVEEEISSANPNLSYGEVRSLCGLMMFSGDDAKKKISVLSGGERSRVLLGKILASPCNLLLLDEPTHHLDMESVEALLLAVKNFQGAVILVTHDETLLQQFGDRMLVCREGEVQYFQGDYHLFLESNGWGEEEEESATETKQSQKEPVKVEKKKNKASPNRIKQCEKAIIDAEEALAIAEAKLEKAVESGDQNGIADYSETVASFQQKIEKLFLELEEMH